VINAYKLYPENAAFNFDNCLLYMGSLYNGSIFVYDPYIGKQVDTINFPGVTGNPVFHVGGVNYDRINKRLSVVADTAASFNTFGGDLSGPNWLYSLDPKTKHFFYTTNLTHVSNGAYAGFQDMDSDFDGNVYTVATFGSALMRTKPNGATTLFYQKPGATGFGFTGIASTGNVLLVNDDTPYLNILRFDVSHRDIGSHVPTPVNISPPIPANASAGDAIYLPSRYENTVLLIALDGEGVRVLHSTDGWKNARNLGVISDPDVMKEAGGPFVTAVFEVGGSIYMLEEWLEGVTGTRKHFPSKDITSAVHDLVDIVQ